MKRLRAVGCLVALACGCAGAGVAQEVRQAATGVAAPTQGEGFLSGMEVLSDTKGVDFQPYLQQLAREIREQYRKGLPDEGAQRGVTLIRVTIRPDGTIAAVHLEGAAEDEGLNRAAWGAITGVGKFAALPEGFHGAGLELRIRFGVEG